MSAITAKASRKMKKYAVLTREPRCFLGSFDFSWEQRKAIDIADYSKGNGYSKGDLTDAGTPIILYGRLYTKYQFAISEVDTFAFPRNGAVYSQGNEVIVPASGETAEDIARASAVEKSGVLLGGDLNILRPFDFINPLFLALAISNGEPQKELAKKAQGKSVVHIHNTDIQEVTIAYPSRTEQDRIVSVFRQLDNLITLHQRKCANLCSPSQVVFSLLFATSTFSWEQRKLSEIAGKVTEKNTGLQYVETLTNSAEFGIISQRDFFDHDISKLGSLDGYYIVRNEDFVYNPRISTSAPVGPINRNKLGRTGVMSPLYTVFRPHDIDTTYLEHFFKCGYWYSFMNFNGDSGARSDRFSIKDDVFFQMPIPVPHIEEQRKIGLFLTQLDQLITLHQRECISFTGRADRLILTANKKRTTSSWEQRKLGDIADIVGGGTPSTGNQSYWDGDIDWYAPAEIADQIYANSSQKKITGLGYENSSAKMLPPGTVLFTSRAGIGKTAILTRKGCTNQGFQSIVPHRGELDSYFIFSRTGELKRYGELVGAGSTFVEVSGKQMAVMELMMPPTMREQQTIGGFFQQLDHLITLHQRKPFLMKWRTSDANRNQTNRLVL